jgi:hypothetical protein
MAEAIPGACFSSKDFALQPAKAVNNDGWEERYRP